MTSKPIQTVLYCTKALSASRFWDNFKVPLSGWLLFRNMSTSASIRLHYDEAGNEEGSYEELKPLHYKPLQVDEGDMIWVSAATSGVQVRVELAKYKPVMQDWQARGEDMVQNVPYSATLVGATTIYNLTQTPAAPATTDIPMAKGYGSYVNIVADAGGFTGTMELSADGGVTYSSPISIDGADPTKQNFEESIIFNYVRVTRTAGTFTIYIR